MFIVVLLVATVLTACGIETSFQYNEGSETIRHVATVLTACGIETQQKPLTFFVVLS